MIPYLLKERLLELSRFLSPIHREGFVQSVVRRLEDLALTYPRTLVFGAAGFCVGQLIDAITGFPAGLPGLLAGGLFGLHRDIEADATSREVSRIISEELRRYCHSSS